MSEGTEYLALDCRAWPQTDTTDMNPHHDAHADTKSVWFKGVVTIVIEIHMHSKRPLLQSTL